jgi:hypothetical protein
MEVGEIFFFTATINQWKPLLKQPAFAAVGMLPKRKTSRLCLVDQPHKVYVLEKTATIQRTDDIFYDPG